MWSSPTTHDCLCRRPFAASHQTHATPSTLTGGRWVMLAADCDQTHVWQTDNVIQLTEGAVVASPGQHGLTPHVGDSPRVQIGDVLEGTASRRVAVKTPLNTAHTTGRRALPPCAIPRLPSPCRLRRLASRRPAGVTQSPAAAVPWGD